VSEATRRVVEGVLDRLNGSTEDFAALNTHVEASVREALAAALEPNVRALVKVLEQVLWEAADGNYTSEGGLIMSALGVVTVEKARAALAPFKEESDA
jgi:hypothetical protein